MQKTAKRGRKSQAEIDLDHFTNPSRPRIKATAPPPAMPLCLGPEAAEIWSQTLLALPEGFLDQRDSEILAAYASHAATFRSLTHQISRFDAEPKWVADENGLQRLKVLTSLRERESRAVASFARQLRLPKQSRTDAGRASTEANGPALGIEKIWE